LFSVAAGAFPAAAGAGSRTPRGCARSGKVVQANSRAVIFSASESDNLPESKVFYGCLRGAQRTYSLGNVADCVSSTCRGTLHPQLAGTEAVYESFVEGRDEAEWYVVVRDLRSGRVLHRVPTGQAASSEHNYTGVGRTTALVVSGAGSVAWIAYDLERSPPSGEEHFYDVYALVGSHARLLASGLDVGPKSLALAGKTVYWTQGGKPASAQLG
jgi:hypothetical protein